MAGTRKRVGISALREIQAKVVSSINNIVSRVKSSANRVISDIRRIVFRQPPVSGVKEDTKLTLSGISNTVVRFFGRWQKARLEADRVSSEALGRQAVSRKDEVEELRREVAYLRKEVERMRRFEEYYKYAQEKVRQVEARTQLYERIASDMKKGKPIADTISDIIKEIEAGMESDYRVVSGQMTEMEYADEKIYERRDILTQSGIDYLRQLALRKHEERTGSGAVETKAEEEVSNEGGSEKEKKQRSIFDALLDFMSDISEKIADVVVGKKK